MAKLKIASNITSGISKGFNNINEYTKELVTNTGEVVDATKHVLTEDIDLIGDKITHPLETGKEVTKAVSNFASDAVHDAKEIGRRAHASMETGFEKIQYLGNKIKQNSIEKLKATGAVISNGVQKASAIIDTGLISVTEGIGQLFGAMIDTGAIVGDSIIGGWVMIFNYEKGQEIMDNAKAFVSEEYVKEKYDDFYEKTNFGKWAKDNSIYFNETRSIGNGVGYYGGAMLLGGAGAGVTGGATTLGTISAGALTAEVTSATALGAGVTAGAGFGKGTEKAWNSGASDTKAMLYGLGTAAWDGVSSLAGVTASGATAGTGKTLLSKIGTKAFRVGFDTIDGAVGSLQDTVLQGLYSDKSFKERFEENGGFISIITGAFMGGLLSSVGEAELLGKLNSKVATSTAGLNTFLKDKTKAIVSSVTSLFQTTKFEKYMKEIENNMAKNNTERKSKSIFESSKKSDVYASAGDDFSKKAIEDIESESADSLKEMVMKVVDMTEADLPKDFSSLEEFKKYFAKYAIKHEKLGGFPCMLLTRDEAIFPEIVDSDMVFRLYTKNFANEKVWEFLIPQLKSIAPDKFKKIFDSPEMVKVVDGLTSDQLINRINCFEYKDVGAYFLDSDCLVDKICSLDDKEFAKFIKKSDYKLRDNLRDWAVNTDDYGNFEKIISRIDEFIKRDNFLNDISVITALDNICPSRYKFDNDSYFYRLIERLYDKKALIESECVNFINKNSDVSVEVKGGIFTIPIEDKEEYYKVFFETNGKENSIIMHKNFDALYINDILNDSEVSKALNNGNFKIKSISVDKLKSALCLTEEQGVQKGLNEIVINVDGNEEKFFYNLRYGSSINLNEYFDPKSSVELKSIRQIADQNVKVDSSDIGSLYSVKYTIDGIEYEKFLNPKDISSVMDDEKKYVLDINSLISGNNLVGIDNIRTSKVETSEIIQKIPTIDRYKTSEEVFNSSKYGGNQDDVYYLLNNLFDPDVKLSSIDQVKSERLLELSKKYFPDISDMERVNLAMNYASGGCNYIAIANSFITWISSIENGEKIFKEKFGFDLYDIDEKGNKSYNMEAIAFEMYLNYAENKFNNGNYQSINEFVKNDEAGMNYIFVDDYHAKSTAYYEKHGIEMNTKYLGDLLECTDRQNTLNHMYMEILDDPDAFHILCAAGFDMELLSDSKISVDSQDGAIANSTKVGNIRKDVGGHAMAITGIDENGNFIVSSWSEKYKFLVDGLVRNELNNANKSFDDHVTTKCGIESIYFSFKD